MHARKTGYLAVLVAAAIAISASAAVAASPTDADAPLTTDHLILDGVPVEVQVDVNGEAAAQLLGDLLDAVADVAQEQAAVAMEAGGGPVPPHVAAIATPLIEPAKNVLKSITRVSVVVMKPGESANPAEIADYYKALMTGRGWTPMVTVRAEDGEHVLVLTAPGGKGIFANVVERNEVVVAMMTTTEPLGNLLAEIVRAGGGHALQGLMAQAAKSRPAPPPPAETPAEPAPEE